MTTFQEEWEAAGDELAKNLEASNAALAENELQRARLLGRAEQAYADLRTDPDQIELIRQRAWGRCGAPITIESDRLVGAPTGWPPDMDEQMSMDAWVRDGMAQFDDPNTRSEEPVSPAVQKFREMIG